MALQSNNETDNSSYHSLIENGFRLMAEFPVLAIILAFLALIYAKALFIVVGTVLLLESLRVIESKYGYERKTLISTIL